VRFCKLAESTLMTREPGACLAGFEYGAQALTWSGRIARVKLQKQ
jgi:hypothetical protein